MSDDPLDPARGEVERQLDEFYRSLSGPARRVESRWRAAATRRQERMRSRSLLAWIGAGAAAAAAVLLLVMAQRSEVKNPEVPIAREFEPRVAPPPSRTPAREIPSSSVPSTPTPPPEDPAPRIPAAVPTPVPPDPAPSEPPQVPAATVEPRLPEPPPEAPKPPVTRAPRAVAVLREIEGSFELSEKNLRGRQKEFTVAAGDRLKAASVVKLTLADDRYILLSPRASVEFLPEGKRLLLMLDQGEMVAELVGPGPEVCVATKTCEILPLGTVFSVKVDDRKTAVAVEKGRVEVRSAKDKATLRAGQAVQASDGALTAAGPAEARMPAWARTHRPVERTLLSEDFAQPRAGIGEVEKGAARAVPGAGMGSIISMVSEKPFFEVPLRGQITIVCRADRASKLKVQLFATDLRMTFRYDLPILRGSAWKAITIDLADFVASEKTRTPGKLPPGAIIADVLLMYGEEGERGNFWVDSIRVTEQR